MKGRISPKLRDILDNSPDPTAEIEQRRVPAAAPLPEEPRKCPICGTKLIPASQAFSEIRERITAEEPPAPDDLVFPGREMTPEDLAALRVRPEEPPALKALLDELLETRRHIASGGCASFDEAAYFAEVENDVRYRVEALVASLSSQLERLKESHGAVCACTLAEPCSDVCSCANNYMSGGCSRCATYGSAEQRMAAALRIASDESSLERLTGELRVSEKARARNFEIYARALEDLEARQGELERLKAEQLTAEEAKALLDGMLEEDLADQAAYEAHTRGFKKLRQISYGSDTGAHP